MSGFGKIAESGQPTTKQPYLNFWQNPQEVLTQRPEKLPLWAIENLFHFFTKERDIIMEYGDREAVGNIELLCRSWGRKHLTGDKLGNPDSDGPDFIFVDLKWNSNGETENKLTEYLTEIARKTRRADSPFQPVIIVTDSSEDWLPAEPNNADVDAYTIMEDLGIPIIGSI